MNSSGCKNKKKNWWTFSNLVEWMNWLNYELHRMIHQNHNVDLSLQRLNEWKIKKALQQFLARLKMTTNGNKKRTRRMNKFYDAVVEMICISKKKEENYYSFTHIPKKKGFFSSFPLILIFRHIICR